jgi:uncharacterized membrane protein YbaN (DUF454 family)
MRCQVCLRESPHHAPNCPVATGATELGLYQAPYQRLLDHKQLQRLVKAYMNSAQFKAQSKAEKAEIMALVRMTARAQAMLIIVRVLFWVVMAGMLAFCIWLWLLL